MWELELVSYHVGLSDVGCCARKVIAPLRDPGTTICDASLSSIFTPKQATFPAYVRPFPVFSVTEEMAGQMSRRRVSETYSHLSSQMLQSLRVASTRAWLDSTVGPPNLHFWKHCITQGNGMNEK